LRSRNALPFITPLVAGHLVSNSTLLERAASFGIPFDKLVVGVAIVHPVISATKPLEILLVQRAALEKVYPGVYELPRGSVIVSLFFYLYLSSD
jgi:hypothetical protein